MNLISGTATVCPDWNALAESRDDGAAGEALWLDALTHREDCEACQAAALAADPTLIFLELPEIELDEEAEVARMQERVAISKDYAQAVREGASHEPAAAASRSSWWLAAAAALVFVAIAPWAPWWSGPGAEEAALTAAANPLAEAADAAPPVAAEPLAPSALQEHLAALPLVEGGDVRYQLTGESVDLAVIVSDGLDL